MTTKWHIPCGPGPKNTHSRKGKGFLSHMDVRQGSLCRMLQEWSPHFPQKKKSAGCSETREITYYLDVLEDMMKEVNRVWEVVVTLTGRGKRGPEQWYMVAIPRGTPGRERIGRAVERQLLKGLKCRERDFNFNLWTVGGPWRSLSKERCHHSCVFSLVNQTVVISVNGRPNGRTNEQKNTPEMISLDTSKVTYMNNM